MAEFIHSEEQFVSIGEPIIFENKTECSFDVDVGVIFRKSGIYKVSIVENRISISEITTALERKHGEWIFNHMSQLWECSNCHKEEIRTTDFCPRCGADMRKYLKHADSDTASGGLASAT